MMKVSSQFYQQLYPPRFGEKKQIKMYLYTVNTGIWRIEAQTINFVGSFVLLLPRATVDDISVIYVTAHRCVGG